jgi:glycerol-3-phosphate dehydrogenase
MRREESLDAVKEPTTWDFIVVGGGATGLGTAVEAASRGYRTLLLEQSDFAKGTSSRSTKLVHGGVRYLQKGNVGLVIDALQERGRLTQNAPHLVSHMAFVVPNYEWWEAPFYGIGLKLYDILAGKLGLGPSKLLSREETLERIPTIEPEGLRGGVIYYDAQFDDARLAITLAQTLAGLGGVPINYMKVTSLTKAGGLICGAIARDVETNEEYELKSRVVVNATGVFTDDIRRMDAPDASSIINPSQGAHIVLDRSFLPGDSAIMVPRTDDERVLFAIPWHGRTLVGTTETPVSEIPLEPRPFEEEIEFLLAHAARYLNKDPGREDVLSAFAGLRPLVKVGDGKDTASAPRDHTLITSSSGLVTITGGKWTTYRKMGEETVDEAAAVAGLEERPSITKTLQLHGWLKSPDPPGEFEIYGSDAVNLRELAEENPGWSEQLHPNLPYRVCEVIWSVRHEMARAVEDFLSRRSRALLLDGRASIEMAPKVAKLMARELGRDEQWEQDQLASYRELAKGYLLDPD